MIALFRFHQTGIRLSLQGYAAARLSVLLSGSGHLTEAWQGIFRSVIVNLSIPFKLLNFVFY